MTTSIISTNVKLIGIHGRAKAGKDTICDFITDTYKSHYREAFADPLKDTAKALFGFSDAQVHDQDLKGTTDPNWLITPRAAMQFIGTEIVRDNLGTLLPGIESNFWIKHMAMRLDNQIGTESRGDYEYGDTVVIPDVRFQNEYDWIINYGGSIIHVTRPTIETNIGGIKDHPSEQPIHLHTPERTYSCVNDTDIPNLYRKVAGILINISL